MHRGVGFAGQPLKALPKMQQPPNVAAPKGQPQDPAARGESEIRGVILAAGKGSRIRPFSETYPKPLLPVLDRPLMVWQIESMVSLGIREITIVIGHLGHRIVSELGDGAHFGAKLTYVEQNEMLGIAHAVGQLERHLNQPFLLFLGDIFFETRNLSTMIDQFHRDGVDAVLAVKRETDPAAIRRNFTVEVDDRGFVRRVVEKPRHPRTDLKGCGLYLFDATIFDAIRRTPRTALRDEYELTDAIQIFLADGYGVWAADVIERDLNMSTPVDLLELNLHAMRRKGHENFVAEGASVDPSAKLEGSVVLRGARVGAGVVLRNCCVLPGEVIAGGTYERSILSSGRVVDCTDEGD